MKKTVCVDLDGVLSEYKGWQGVEKIGPPIPGSQEFTRKLSLVADVVIFTTRCNPEQNPDYEPGFLRDRQALARLERIPLPLHLCGPWKTNRCLLCGRPCGLLPTGPQPTLRGRTVVPQITHEMLSTAARRLPLYGVNPVPTTIDYLTEEVRQVFIEQLRRDLEAIRENPIYNPIPMQIHRRVESDPVINPIPETNDTGQIHRDWTINWQGY